MAEFDDSWASSLISLRCLVLIFLLEFMQGDPIRRANATHFPVPGSCLVLGIRKGGERQVMKVVIASEAKQSRFHAAPSGLLRRQSASKTRVNALIAPRNDGRITQR